MASRPRRGIQPEPDHVPTTTAAARLAALAALDLVDAQDEPGLLALVRFAARLCEAEAAAVNLLDRDAVRTIASVGLDGPAPLALVRRTVARGELTLTRGQDMVGEAADLPWRFHAGLPLKSEKGVVLGTLAVFDRSPREALTQLQEDGLRLLAEQVAVQFARRRVAREAAAATGTRLFDDIDVRRMIDAVPQMVWSTRPDGYHDFFNARWYQETGTPPGSTDGEAWADLFHPDDQEETWGRWAHSLETGDPYEIEYRLRGRDGRWRWVLGRALPLRDADGTITRWVGTCTDIDERKRLAEEREIVSHELSHRIKNIFSVISGLLAFSARNRPEVSGFAADLRARILALGRAHDFVRPHSQNSEPPHATDHLHGLVEEILAPYQTGTGRVVVRGPNPPIDDRSATPLALLLHELATNAAKYGALSEPDGRVTVEIADRGDAIALRWQEAGGPALTTVPEHEGFGSRLIELSGVRQLNARLTREWRADGLLLEVVVPKASLTR